MLERIIINEKTGCWLWNGAKDRTGYGHILRKGKTFAAHRLSYSLYKGSIPPKYLIHHKCEIRNCINPEHLQAVDRKTHYVDIHYSILKAGKIQAKNRSNRTHCVNGHEFTEENVYLESKSKFRRCKACRKNVDRKRRSKNRWRI